MREETKDIRQRTARWSMLRKRIRTFAMILAVVALMVVVAVYVIPISRHRSQNVALGMQWAGLLKKYPGFSGQRPAYTHDVSFTYAASTDENLSRLREAYHLEAVAGPGSETERIINLMTWVHRLTGHANEPRIPKELNAFNLIRLAKDENMQMNCYMKTIILNEVYLSMGWQSRQTHLLPYAKEDEESHFITSVYAPALGRWILMDPDFGTYLTDEKGNILGVREVRKRLVSGRPLVVKDVDAGGRLATAWENAGNFIRRADYLWFLTDFVFKIRCPKRSIFNQAAESERVYFELVPDGYREELLREPELTKSGRRIVYLNDEDLFWQKP